MATQCDRLVCTFQNLDMEFLLSCHNFLSQNQVAHSPEAQSHTQKTGTSNRAGKLIGTS